MKRQRESELRNGRAAMLGITSVLIAGNLPGAVPVLDVIPDFPAGASFVLPL